MAQRFARGAVESPRHKLLAAEPYRIVKAPPSQFAVVPKQLSYWLNNQEGDCVTAEEAFAKAWFSVFAGMPELFIPDSVVGQWAAQYGFANGATLTDVMDQMAKDGFTVNGQNYKDGGYSGVDYSNETVLQSALTVGPVKIAIDANALPQSAGNQQGWYATGGSPGQYPNTDHCVGLAGYGPASFLFQQLGVPLPSSLANASGYLLFTWSSIGFVDHNWLMSTCTEAWVRNPTTVGQGPPPSPPSPPVVPPVPPAPPTPTFPNYTGTVSLTGTIPGIFGGSQVTLAGPLTMSPATTKRAEAAMAGLSWTQVLQLAELIIKYGTVIVPVVEADLAAGKPWLQIVEDVISAFGTAAV